MKTCEVTFVIVSYNTARLLKRCLESVLQELQGIQAEIIVVDNASKDGSVELVEKEFPEVYLIPSQINLGFAAANNLAFRISHGEFIVLLNTDAFLKKGALLKALETMKADEKIGLAGGRLIGEKGEWQPSARQFPSLINDFLHLSGLASRYPHSRFFGKADRTWASPEESSEVDWVPGAFTIMRRQIINEVGLFDERFFLYYEEVDFCKRIKKAGYTVWYLADVQVIHLGGESSKTVQEHAWNKSGSQLTLWRMRSMFLYYRKWHYWMGAWSILQMESGWNWLRALKNGNTPKGNDARKCVELLQQAWKETNGGTVSPRKPW